MFKHVKLLLCHPATWLILFLCALPFVVITYIKHTSAPTLLSMLSLADAQNLLSEREILNKVYDGSTPGAEFLRTSSSSGGTGIQVGDSPTLTGKWTFTPAASTNPYGIQVNTWSCGAVATCAGAIFNAPTGATTNYAFQAIDGIGSLTFRNASQANLVLTGVNATLVMDTVGSNYPGLFIKASGTTIGTWGGDASDGSSSFAAQGAIRFGAGGIGVPAQLWVATTGLILGTGDATATPLGLTLRGPNATGTNIAGVVTTLQASLGTGTGARGTLVLAGAAAAEASGTTQHTAVAHMTVGDGKIILNSDAVTPATTGTRYLCISTTGVVSSSASACSGT